MVFIKKTWKAFYEMLVDCAGSLDPILAPDIFTLTDVSFHYSSEKNEQAHARGRGGNHKSMVVKLGLDHFTENKNFYE